MPASCGHVASVTALSLWACSAQNVKKWEEEMQTLKTNNLKLTAALKESNQHVAEWKDKLHQYKEESAALKKKVHTYFL